MLIIAMTTGLQHWRDFLIDQYSKLDRVSQEKGFLTVLDVIPVNTVKH